MWAVKLRIAAALILALASPSQAQSPAAQRGLTFVRTNCAQCHAIDKVSASTLRIAPPFRSLHRMYPVDLSKRRWPRASAQAIRRCRSFGSIPARSAMSSLT